MAAIASVHAPARGARRAGGTGRGRVAGAMIWWLAYVRAPGDPRSFASTPLPRAAPAAACRRPTSRCASWRRITRCSMPSSSARRWKRCVRGGAARGRALGTAAVRRRGCAAIVSPARALGEALSPLVTPRPGAALVTARPVSLPAASDVRRAGADRGRGAPDAGLPVGRSGSRCRRWRSWRCARASRTRRWRGRSRSTAAGRRARSGSFPSCSEGRARWRQIATPTELG